MIGLIHASENGPDQRSSDLREAARRYAADGVPVFPLAPATNRPFEKGYRDGMLLDPQDRLAAWDREPRCNVGLFLVGRIVIDVDRHGTADGEESLESLQKQFGRLPGTFTVRTPRNGRHLHFAVANGDLGGIIGFAPGVDVLGSSRHAVLPPSVRTDGLYVAENDAPVAPLPDAWLKAIVEYGRERRQTSGDAGEPPSLKKGVGTSYGPIVERARKYVERFEGVQKGSRNDEMFRIACCLQNDFILESKAAWKIFVKANQKNRPPLGAEEMRQIFSSAALNANRPRGALVAQQPSKISAQKAPAPPTNSEAEKTETPAENADPEEHGQIDWDSDPDEESQGPQPVLTLLSEVETRPVQWLWPKKIALGKLTMVGGDPGLGKSFLTIDLAARVTAGRSWPGEDKRKQHEPAGVLLISAEDSADDTIKPRFVACEGNPALCAVLEAQAILDENGKQTKQAITLDDLGAVEAALAQIKATGTVTKLVVVDPISAYMGRADSHNNAEVRGALSGLAEMAARRNVAVVCVTHLRKGDGKAVYRMMGSLGFVAAARAAYVVCADSNDERGERKLFLPVKNNLAPDKMGFSFFVKEPWGGGCPRVEWGSRVEAGDVEAILNPMPSARGPDPEAREAAAEWLEAELADGPKPVKEVLRNAKACGHSEKTLRRAVKILGVVTKKENYDEGWTWRLPPSKVAKFPY